MTNPLNPALNDAMAGRVARGELPGLVTVLAYGDDVEVTALGELSFGGTPMRRDTIFRIASLTKPVLAAATMLLVEDGTLALDEPVDRVLPELADRQVLRTVDGALDDTVPAERPITVEDLLTFRLGHGMITEPSFQPAYPVITAAREKQLVLDVPDPRTPLDPDEWIRRFSELPLMDQPGTRWRYNTGTLVLGVLLARAAEKPLEEVLAERLFRPLGMSDTGFWLPAEKADRIPAYYMSDLQGGPVQESPSSPAIEWTRPPAFPSGSSGLLSTADDCLAFAQMLRRDGDGLLSSDSVRRMTSNQLTGEQLGSAGMLLGGRGWGYGMSVTVAADDFTDVPGRYGWEGGYGTVWFTDPHRDLIAIALTQVSDFLFTGGAAEFTRLAYAR
ncbi:MAG: beta-lactamase family protein [Hamadaea sp.]|uniref:serine hydrolase domain-containing protein n=1 Tax=Hamadaea sp. TaxID=2024425 RepID=UPI0018268FDC|nr:serine hydrolase domain-containing protein [Hamadaea sp.]NUR69383.1 beta-lactamase family protein [Hamadaea sp.]NUT23200.1 beta-lactamase family protein [Hamadaea sp.]